MSLRPFRAEDYLDAVPGQSAEGPIDARLDPLRVGQLYVAHGPAFTLRIDGRVAACYGMTLPWPGLGQVWMLVSPVGRAHPVPVVRSARRLLGAVIVAKALRRVEADVRADFEAGHRFIRSLGFQVESVMPKYGPNGEPFIRYVLFP